MKIIFVLMILVFLLPISAGGANWQLVAKNKENRIYIDKENINYTSKNLVKAWFKIVPNESVKILKNYMIHQIAYEEHNCGKHEFRVLQLTGHHSDGTSEEVISEPSEWIDVSSHIIFKTKHEYLCRQAGRNKIIRTKE